MIPEKQLNQPDTSPALEIKSLPSASFHSIKLTSFFILIFVGITAAILALYGYFYLRTFAKAANQRPQEIISAIRDGLTSPPTQTNSEFKTLLILGTDALDNRPGSPILTDTIILATIHLKSGRVNLLSLPRDLWHEEYATRINAFYFYGLDRDPNQPELFATQAISELTSITFDHTIVIGLNQLADLVDILDGVEINIPEGFTDSQFPRTDVDVTKVFDPSLLYETITFNQGPELMNSERALKYVRSRKSKSDQGTDNARAARQQQLIQAILGKSLTQEIISSPQISGRLYGWYQTEINKYWATPDFIATAKTIYPAIHDFSIQTNQISISDQENQGVIFHPPTTEYNGQWVYAIENQDEFWLEIKNKLFETQ